MSTTITTDRARYVDIALANGWEVVNMGQYFTELVKDDRLVSLIWNAGDVFAEVDDKFGATLATDQAEAASLLRGERLRDAASARYFEVVEPADGDLDHAEYRETDKHHAFVQSGLFGYREVVLLAGLARDARGLAKATGSRRSTQVETVFGVELHVTWVRA